MIHIYMCVCVCARTSVCVCVSACVHILLLATLTQVFTCAGGADVSLRDVTIAQMGNGASECE